MRPLPLWAVLLFSPALSAQAATDYENCLEFAIAAKQDPNCLNPLRSENAELCKAVNSGATSACLTTVMNAMSQIEALAAQAEKGAAGDPAARRKLLDELEQHSSEFYEGIELLRGLPKDNRYNLVPIADDQLAGYTLVFDTAQEQLKAALGRDGSGDPASPAAAKPAAPALREFLVQEGRRRERDAQTGQPADSQQLDLAGKTYLAAGRPGDAERVAQALVRAQPGRAEGHALLAESAFAQGRTREAKAAAEEALRLDPKNRSARAVLGYADALIRGQRKVQVSKADLGGTGTGADAGSGVALGSGGTAAVAPAGAPRNLVPLARRALDLLRMNDHLGALEAINRYIDAEPSDPEALLIRSDLLQRLGKPEAALKDAEAVLALLPDDPRALRAKAAALHDLGRHEEALAVIDRALALDPASGAGHFTRAKILEALGRVEEAIAAYRKAAALDEAVAPLAEAALKRLGAGSAVPAAAVPRKLLRGGLITVSLALILLGLIGGAVVATRRRAATRAAEAAKSAERTLRPGDLVARQYRIVRELGRGGMGVVFEAVDETLKRPVALKQLQADFRMSAEDAARFLQEARLVAQVRHPNVAEIYAAVEDGGLFLVFELVKGRSLDAWAGAGLTPEQARGVVASACAALEAAHARRIVHRDLKPSNLMVGDDGVVKVMDFGIAHQSRGGAAFTQTAASGTPPYMAPEQAMGTVSASSDLYALAVMAYELLCGRRPFEGPDFLGPKLRGEFRPLTARRPGLPARLDAFFESALAADPARRPADAKAFRAAFDACWS